jgi:hypothetical protein
MDAVIDPRIAVFDFGDVVRVRRGPETDSTPYTGREGDVYGTSLRIEEIRAAGDAIVGSLKADECLVAVRFADARASVWFARHLVEFVRREEVVIRVGPNSMKRLADGKWVPLPPEARTKGKWRKLFGWFRSRGKVDSP